jgi:sortase A
LNHRLFKPTALLFAIAGLCLGRAGFVLVRARWYDAVEKQRLREESWGGPARAGLLHGGLARRCRQAALAGRSWARLEADGMELSAPVVEGVGREQLLRAVGHLPGSAFPGEAGNVVLAGHRDMHFAPLRNAAVGDRLSLITPDGTFDYAVTTVSIVDPSAVGIERPTTRPMLTLITCYPFEYLGPAPYRMVVRALMTEGSSERVALRPRPGQRRVGKGDAAPEHVVDVGAQAEAAEQESREPDHQKPLKEPGDLGPAVEKGGTGSEHEDRRHGLGEAARPGCRSEGQRAATCSDPGIADDFEGVESRHEDVPLEALSEGKKTPL